MDVFEAINQRRSVSKVLPDPVSHELISTLLEAAVQAPNHFRVTPWRFFVLTGTARNRLGDVMAQSLLKRHPESAPATLDAERARPLRAPVVIAVSAERPSQPKVLEIENIAAVSAAVQNLLLAAHGVGLGAMWRTGPAAMDPDVKAFFGLEPEEHLLAFVYVGYPASPPEPYERLSYEARTIWMEE